MSVSLSSAGMGLAPSFPILRWLPLRSRFSRDRGRALQCGNLSRGVREDRANRWVIAVFAAIGLLAAYLPAYTDRQGF